MDEDCCVCSRIVDPLFVLASASFLNLQTDKNDKRKGRHSHQVFISYMCLIYYMVLNHVCWH